MITIYGAISVIGFILCGLSLFGDADMDLDDPGIFSVRIVGLFVGTFGSCGLIFAGFSHEVQFAAAIIGGIIFTKIGRSVLKYIYQQQSNSLKTDQSWQDALAVVTVPITEKKIGEICIRNNDKVKYEMATADSAIGKGEEVKIINVIRDGSSVLVVEKINEGE